MRNVGTSPYPSFPSQSQGFFKRHMRRLSSSLPQFTAPHHHAVVLEKQKAIERRQSHIGGSLLSRARRAYLRMGPKLRSRLLIGLVLWLFFHFLYARKCSCMRAMT